MSGIPAGAGSLIGKRVGKYDILALLALGGTAEIYLARVGGAGGFEKYVVVKCLHDHLADDQDFVKMFLDEARLAALLDHSNIVQTFELGEYENRYYMVMEFLAGLSLAMIVRRAAERIPSGLLPVPIIFNVAAQAAAGLHYAHDRTANGRPLNMVHRDISPQNLVISFEGVVKVVDFGIARAEMRETKTKAGTIKGKFAYMSPEQCVATNVDRRTDVFALGVIVHELLTGRRLFKRASPYETYQAVIECAVDPPSTINNQLDPAIDAVVMKALAKDKEKRYPSAEAFGDALLGYLHHRGKASGGAELSRFFEQYFADEIEEHGERMRELISGRDFAVDTGLGWGEEDDKANMTVDLGARKEDSLIIGEIYERGSEPSLENYTRDLGRSDDDEIPAEKTRIELNPLQKVEELNQQVARNSAGRVTATDAAVSARTPPGAMPTAALKKSSGPTPVPPGTITTGVGAAPLPAPPTGPRPVVDRGAGKFPDLPNMPTVSGERNAPELAPTALGKGKLVDPASTPPYDPSQPMVPAVSAASATQYAVRASQMQIPQGVAQTGPQALAQQQSGYPQESYPQVTGPHQPVMTSYPVLPGGGRPLSSDLAPSNLPSSQRSPYVNGPFDPNLAANVMSPVGDQYPQADWQRMAGMQAKAIPKWALIALFIAALGGALILTLAIAKIFAA